MCCCPLSSSLVPPPTQTCRSEWSQVHPQRKTTEECGGMKVLHNCTVLSQWEAEVRFQQVRVHCSSFMWCRQKELFSFTLAALTSLQNHFPSDGIIFAGGWTNTGSGWFMRSGIKHLQTSDLPVWTKNQEIWVHVSHLLSQVSRWLTCQRLVQGSGLRFGLTTRGFRIPRRTVPGGAHLRTSTASARLSMSSWVRLTDTSWSPGSKPPWSSAEPPGTRDRITITHLPGSSGSCEPERKNVKAKHQILPPVVWRYSQDWADAIAPQRGSICRFNHIKWKY